MMDSANYMRNPFTKILNRRSSEIYTTVLKVLPGSGFASALWFGTALNIESETLAVGYLNNLFNNVSLTRNGPKKEKKRQQGLMLEENNDVVTFAL